jgi:hypothetical protein
VQFIPSGDPSAAAAHEALVSLVNELEKLSLGKKLEATTHAA